MRSVVVVLPASTCAMTPMFLSFLVFMQIFLTAGVRILTHAARVALRGTATPPKRIRVRGQPLMGEAGACITINDARAATLRPKHERTGRLLRRTGVVAINLS